VSVVQERVGDGEKSDVDVASVQADAASDETAVATVRAQQLSQRLDLEAWSQVAWPWYALRLFGYFLSLTTSVDLGRKFGPVFVHRQ